MDDINLGLQHFYGEFNVAHARLVASGVRAYLLFTFDSILSHLGSGDARSQIRSNLICYLRRTCLPRLDMCSLDLRSATTRA